MHTDSYFSKLVNIYLEKDGIFLRMINRRLGHAWKKAWGNWETSFLRNFDIWGETLLYISQVKKW